jgi:hypothetical protein
LLADGLEASLVAEEIRLGHPGDLGLRVGPGLVGAVADQGGDAQAELERRVLTAQLGLQGLQTVDAFGDAVEWFTPEELDVGVGGGDSLSGGGGATEVQAWVWAAFAGDRAGGDGRAGDREVLAGEGDVLLGPQSADELQELLGACVSLSLVALAVPVRRQVVLPRHDVDQQPPVAELVQGRRRRREVRWLPVARSDRGQGLEGRSTGG